MTKEIETQPLPWWGWWVAKFGDGLRARFKVAPRDLVLRPAGKTAFIASTLLLDERREPYTLHTEQKAHVRALAYYRRR